MSLSALYNDKTSSNKREIQIEKNTYINFVKKDKIIMDYFESLKEKNISRVEKRRLTHLENRRPTHARNHQQCKLKSEFILEEDNGPDPDMEEPRLKRYTGPLSTEPITALAETIDGNYLYICNEKGHMVKYNLTDAKIVKEFGQIHDGVISSIAATADGKYLLTSDSTGTCKQFDLETDKLYNDFGQIHTREIHAIVVSYDSKRFYTADGGGYLKEFSVWFSKLYKNFGRVHAVEIFAIAITKSNEYLFTSDMSGRLKQYSLEEKVLHKDFGKVHQKAIMSCCCSWDDQYLFTADIDGSLKQFSIQTGTLIKEYEKVSYGIITSIKCTRNNKFMFICDDVGHLKEFSIPEKRQLVDFGEVHFGAIKSIIISHNDQYLYSSDSNGDLKRFTIKKIKEVIDWGKVHGSWVHQIAATLDDKYLFTTSNKGNLRQFQINDATNHITKQRDPVNDFGRIHEDEIHSIKISCDNKFLVTSDIRGYVKQFDIEKANLFKDFGRVHDAPIKAIEIVQDAQDPKRHWLFTSDINGNLKKFLLESQKRKTINKLLSNINDGDQDQLTPFGKSVVGFSEESEEELSKGFQSSITEKEFRPIPRIDSVNEFAFNKKLNEKQGLITTKLGRYTNRNIAVVKPYSEPQSLSNQSIEEIAHNPNKTKTQKLGIKQNGIKEICIEEVEEESVNYSKSQSILAEENDVVKTPKQNALSAPWNLYSPLVIDPNYSNDGSIESPYKGDGPREYEDSNGNIFISSVNIGVNTKMGKKISGQVKVQLQEVQPENPIYDFGKLMTGEIFSMTATPDKKSLFVSDNDGCLKQIDILTNEIVMDYGKIHKGQIMSIDCTKDNKYLFTSDRQANQKQFMIAEKKELKNYGKVHVGHILDIKCSWDNKYLFTVSSQGVLKQWLISEQRELREISGIHQGQIQCITTTPSSRFIITSDNQGYVRQIRFNLDKFVLGKYIWTRDTDFMSLDGIFYFNYQHDLNYFSDRILSKIANEQYIQLKNFLTNNIPLLKIAYGQVSIISEKDIIILIYAYIYCGLSNFIPNFIKTIKNNTRARKPAFSKYYEYIMKCMDDNTGPKIMRCMTSLQFSYVQELSRGTRRLQESVYVYSEMTTRNYDEKKDWKTFLLPEKGIPPIEIECYKFDKSVNLLCPTEPFVEYLCNLSVYLKDDDLTLTDEKISYFIEFLWCYYKKQLQVLLAISVIPLGFLYQQAFLLELHPETNTAFCWIVFLTSLPLLFYEIIQVVSAGWSYLDLDNFFDQGTCMFYILNSFYMMFHNTWNPNTVSLYVVTLQFAGSKFYFNLGVFDFIRSLSSTQIDILQAIVAYFVIVILFIIAFSNMFYISKFWNGRGLETDWGKRNFGQYFMWTADVIFGNWDEGSPETDDLIWINLIFIILSFLFTIIVANVLIALVCDNFLQSIENKTSNDNKSKLKYVIEVIKIRRLFKTLFERTESKSFFI